MRTVLLTGFEPFDQDTLNPSWEAVKALDQRLIKEDTRIVSRQLPCVFSQAPARLRELLETVRPDLVIAGAFTTRSTVSLLQRFGIPVAWIALQDTPCLGRVSGWVAYERVKGRLTFSLGNPDLPPPPESIAFEMLTEIVEITATIRGISA